MLRVGLWLGGRALRARAAEAAPGVDEIEREPFVADLRLESVRRGLPRVDRGDDLVRDTDDDPGDTGHRLLNGRRVSLLARREWNAETCFDDVVVGADDAHRDRY